MFDSEKLADEYVSFLAEGDTVAVAEKLDGPVFTLVPVIRAT